MDKYDKWTKTQHRARKVGKLGSYRIKNVPKIGEKISRTGYIMHVWGCWYELISKYIQVRDLRLCYKHCRSPSIEAATERPREWKPHSITDIVESTCVKRDGTYQDGMGPHGDLPRSWISRRDSWYHRYQNLPPTRRLGTSWTARHRWELST